ncbi:hypothetical protein ZHAS_00000405 [Anopheles sinensis]|uniref:Uncharacterized protein n=1 Tax=Anopheles sinensis TaxID=74873 RepID=A0A084VA63_ANOSI|nr:hypothetical protein ZHAS_00000405 [Anopheles sinensis]
MDGGYFKVSARLIRSFPSIPTAFAELPAMDIPFARSSLKRCEREHHPQQPKGLRCQRGKGMRFAKNTHSRFAGSVGP